MNLISTEQFNVEAGDYWVMCTIAIDLERSLTYMTYMKAFKCFLAMARYIGYCTPPPTHTPTPPPSHTHTPSIIDMYYIYMVLGHNPPGHVPPGHLPQGHIPPGHLPPGHLPPGHLPPRTYTPWDIYPMDTYPQDTYPLGHRPPEQIPPEHIRLAQTFETERKKLLFTLLYY